MKLESLCVEARHEAVESFPGDSGVPPELESLSRLTLALHKGIEDE